MSLAREKKTIEAMIQIFCPAHHNSSGRTLCGECQELLDYAMVRLEKCPFGADKGPCAKCAVHCYKPDMRQRIREVMHFAGPKMLKKHPLLAITHLLKNKPPKADKNNPDN